jgi:hypothetical protein
MAGISLFGAISVSVMSPWRACRPSPHLYPPLIGGVELSSPFDPAKILPIIAESRTTQLVLDSASGIDARYH